MFREKELKNNSVTYQTGIQKQNFCLSVFLYCLLLGTVNSMKLLVCVLMTLKSVLGFLTLSDPLPTVKAEFTEFLLPEAYR